MRPAGFDICVFEITVVIIYENIAGGPPGIGERLANPRRRGRVIILAIEVIGMGVAFNILGRNRAGKGVEGPIKYGYIIGHRP